MKTQKIWTFWLILTLFCTQTVLAVSIDVCPMMIDPVPAELTSSKDQQMQHAGMSMQSDSQASLQNCCDDNVDSAECMTMGCAMVSIPSVSYQFAHFSQYQPQVAYLLNSPQPLARVFFRPPIV